MWLDMLTHVRIFESSRLEGLYVGDLLYVIVMIVSWAYSRSSISAGSVSAYSTNRGSKTLGKKKFQKVPNTKTWICDALAAIYIAFTLYLQLFI